MRGVPFLEKRAVGRRKWRAAVAVATLAAGLVVVAPTPASAHFLGYDSVDGGEIAWEDQTTWDDARTHAINTWDARGHVDFVEDGWTTVADLEFNNANRSDVTWDGLYTNQSGADTIQLNTYYFNGYTDTKRRGVAAHEVGHALGLAHSMSGQLMVDNTSARGNINTPQSHDIADYNELWG